MKSSPSPGTRIYSISLWWATIGLAVYGVYFRAVVWPSWPPVDPNDPYGLSDILEAVIALTLYALCGLCLLSGIGTFAFRATSRPLAIYLILTGIILPFVYHALQTRIPFK